ncbi:MAG: EamA family transporter [Planctomycetota bacterium]
MTDLFAYAWLAAAIACQVGMVLAYRSASHPGNNRYAVLVGAYLISTAVSVGLGYCTAGRACPAMFAVSLNSAPMYLGIGGGILLVFSAELYLRSTAAGPLSITWTIRQTESMPATVISFFKDAGEFTPLRLTGVLLLLPTLLMFGWDKRVQERRAAARASAEAARATQNGEAVTAPPVPVPWMLYVVLSMLLLGAYRVNTLWISPEIKTQFMFFQYLTCTLFALAAVLLQGHRMHTTELLGGLILGVLSSFNLFFTLTSMTTVGPVATFTGLAVGVPTAVTLIGWRFYRERLQWRSLAGLGMALAAMLLTVPWQTLHRQHAPRHTAPPAAPIPHATAVGRR